MKNNEQFWVETWGWYGSWFNDLDTTTLIPLYSTTIHSLNIILVQYTCKHAINMWICGKKVRISLWCMHISRVMHRIHTVWLMVSLSLCLKVHPVFVFVRHNIYTYRETCKYRETERKAPIFMSQPDRLTCVYISI